MPITNKSSDYIYIYIYILYIYIYIYIKQHYLTVWSVEKIQKVKIQKL